VTEEGAIVSVAPRLEERLITLPTKGLPSKPMRVTVKMAELTPSAGTEARWEEKEDKVSELTRKEDEEGSLTGFFSLALHALKLTNITDKVI
jgi:hypothetical protein